MRRRQYLYLTLLAFFVFCTVYILRIGPERSIIIPHVSGSRHPAPKAPPPTWQDPPVVHGGPLPKPVDNTESHPIWYLMNDAQRQFSDKFDRQSKTLADAVQEYRRRYGMPPPPRFEMWFKFAQENNVQMVDEFDTIYDLITPFWGLSPKTIRDRAKEALGFPNQLLGVSIRERQVSRIEGGDEWQRNATEGMLEKFLEFLPDMDLAFNLHDEPRVVLAHEDLTRLVEKAKAVNMAAAASHRYPANDWSPHPADMNDGTTFEETKVTRFNVFAHQATWTNSRMSCPPDSPARILDDNERADDMSRYGFSELGFIYNTTAMSDICLSPSLSSTYGFFDRPNAYNIVHDLFPIFSQSKISSYADLIYPSPWYWWGKVEYDEDRDMEWTKKQDKLYWRGSTTGGFSRDGGWRRQHRQQFVQKINAGDQAKILVNDGGNENPKWEVKEEPRGNFREAIDVHFSHVGQCDDYDCDAQKQFFDITDRVDSQDAWGFKHLLDIDGNAFSGRFYSFLESRSLTFKLALFREWHQEWLKPWVHYIPLSLQGDDWLEAVRFFGEDSLGNNEAERIAMASREWAQKVVRKEDMEAWFFRLLLE